MQIRTDTWNALVNQLSPPHSAIIQSKPDITHWTSVHQTAHSKMCSQA